MIEALIYILIAYVVGIAVGHGIGRRRGIQVAEQAARKEIAKMQAERLQRSEARLQESLDGIKVEKFVYPRGLKYPENPKGDMCSPEETADG